MRAPLSNILGLIEIEAMDTHSLESTTHLKLIKESAMQLDSVIQNVLNYSRNSRLETVFDKIDLDSLIIEYLHSVSYLPEYSDISISKKIDLKNDFYTDKSRLSIIINNLISNAIKYQDSAKENSFLEINIREHNDKILFEFVDNGIGIPSEHHENILKMFYRANTTKIGSGLGLFIVKEMVGKLNGFICFESEFGVGTKFTIEIPNMNSIAQEVKAKENSLST